MAFEICSHRSARAAGESGFVCGDGWPGSSTGTSEDVAAAFSFRLDAFEMVR